MSEGGKRVMEVEDFGKLKGCPWPDFWAGDGNSDAKRSVEIAKAGSQDASEVTPTPPRAIPDTGMYRFHRSLGLMGETLGTI